MMPLSLMRDVLATLDDEGASPLADRIAAAWPHDAGTVRFLRASANFVSTFSHGGCGYVLRFNHASERSVAAIRAELAFMAHLAARGIGVAAPLASHAGRLVESVETSEGVFHAVAFERLAGEQFETDALTPDMAERWGQALGALHTASREYTTVNRPSWREHIAWAAAQIPASDQAAHTALAAVSQRIAALPTQPDRCGLIHFDFELDNVIWQTDRVGVVDFDDCAAYPWVADIAYALRDLWDDSAAQFNAEHLLFQRFVAGYRRAMPIDDTELALVPLFLRLHNLLMFARVQRALGTAAPDEPPWLGKLRERLAHKMERYRREFGGLL